MSRVRWSVTHENRHTAFDGRLYLERRPNLSPNWYARCCHGGSQIYKTTKSSALSDAKETAEKWFVDLLFRIEHGETIKEKTLADAYRAFLAYHEDDLLKTGASNPRKIKNYKSLWNGIQPELGDKPLSTITSQLLEQFRAWRIKKSAERGKSLTEKTLHNYMGLIRLCLKYAARHGWLEHLPQFPEERIKHVHPDWLTEQQLQGLITASQNRLDVDRQKAGNAANHILKERTELHAFIWMMAHGCIRVDECLNLRWEDVKPHPKNDDVPPFKRQALLKIRGGKTGDREGVGTFGVLIALNYLRQVKPDAKPTDKLFSSSHRHGMAKLLTVAKLRKDDKGRLRNAKTLRHTSIMLRFLFEPTISAFELAKISGTSANVLSKYYLNHLTGQRVSERLMQAALAEYTKVKKPAKVTWATSDGELKTVRRKKRAG